MKESNSAIRIINIKKNKLIYIESIYKLYHKTILLNPDVLSPTAEEVTKKFVKQRLNNAIKNGVFVVAYNGSEIVGCVIGIIESYLKYSHFLSDITLMVDKEYQNSLLSIKLITNTIQYAFNEYKDLKYISTEVHSINKKSIRIIKKVGFTEEYVMPKKVLLSDGRYCDKVGLILDRENYKWQRNIATKGCNGN